MHEFLAINAAFDCALPKPANRVNGFRYVQSRPDLDALKHQLQTSGWSYRAASEVLGVSLNHFACVITGRRQSEKLLSAIRSLSEMRRP